MLTRQHRRDGFTIVEVLVVISIIGVLAGLLLPAVSNAHRRALKAEEMNRLRQVGIAWSLYANANSDAALPGFLPADVQSDNDPLTRDWKVTYKLPSKDPVRAADAEEWPWRLMKYLDYSHDVVLGYRKMAEPSELAMEYRDPPVIMDPAFDPNGTLYSSDTERPVTIAEQPAFGYNAEYVGGWWDRELEVEDDSGTVVEIRPMPRYYDHKENSPGGRRVNLIVHSPAQIHRTSDFIVFCSSSLQPPGKQVRRIEDNRPGCHWVHAPYGPNNSGKVWSVGSDPSYVVTEGNQNVAVPAGRYTGQVAILNGDLHTQTKYPGSLDDQRFWINIAEGPDFIHWGP
jgi:prepilin-type N-terminal cleavage/methylation domain-containing protein